jgi:hypothetical protein
VSGKGTSDLIGGHVATDAEYPATLLIKGLCTATKVGPRHILTAAHCVSGPEAPYFVSGATIEVTSDKGIGAFAHDASVEAGQLDGGASPFKTYTIDETHLEPNWVAKCTGDLQCGKSYVSCRTAVADVALVVVREPIETAAEASIDLSPVEVDDRVVIAGYGCEDGVGAWWNYDNQRLRVAETRAISFDNTIHTGSVIFEEDRNTPLARTMDGIYVITPGPNFADGGDDASDSGGLCPGDSGGPLYRLDGKGLTVVGVHSSYTFSTGFSFALDGGHTVLYGGKPVTNWHTRLDDTRGLEVGKWLKGLGVNVVCSRGNCPELGDGPQ